MIVLCVSFLTYSVSQACKEWLKWYHLHRHLSFLSLVALERMDTVNVNHKGAAFRSLFKLSFQ